MTGPVVEFVARNKRDYPGVPHVAMTLPDIHSNLVLSGWKWGQELKNNVYTALEQHDGH